MTPQKVERVVSHVNGMLGGTTNSIKFDIDKDSGEVTLIVYNSESGEKVRQIPDDKAIEIMLHFDRIAGLIVDEEI